MAFVIPQHHPFNGFRWFPFPVPNPSTAGGQEWL